MKFLYFASIIAIACCSFPPQEETINTPSSLDRHSDEPIAQNHATFTLDYNQVQANSVNAHFAVQWPKQLHEPTPTGFHLVQSAARPPGVFFCAESNSEPFMFGMVHFHSYQFPDENSATLATLRACLARLCAYKSAEEAVVFARTLSVVETHVASQVQSACLLACSSDRTSWSMFLMAAEWRAVRSASGGQVFGEGGGQVSPLFHMFKQNPVVDDIIYAVVPEYMAPIHKLPKSFFELLFATSTAPHIYAYTPTTQ